MQEADKMEEEKAGQTKTDLEKFYAFEPFWMDDPEVSKLKSNARRLCYEYNASPEGDQPNRLRILKELFGTAGDDMFIKPPFFCDYGINIHVGKKFFANFDVVMLDMHEIRIGDNCLIGPQCGFYTAIHPKNVKDRIAGTVYGKPITVGDNVWFGGHCTILPGVTIGNNVIVGAGSVVTKDVPDDVIVAGNPARIIAENKESAE